MIEWVVECGIFTLEWEADGARGSFDSISFSCRLLTGMSLNKLCFLLYINEFVYFFNELLRTFVHAGAIPKVL